MLSNFPASLIIIMVLALFADPAIAECQQPSGFISDSSAEVNSRNFRFLVCIHNQQNEDLVALLAIIQELDERIVDLENDRDAIVERIHDLSNGN